MSPYQDPSNNNHYYTGYGQETETGRDYEARRPQKNKVDPFTDGSFLCVKILLIVCPLLDIIRAAIIQDPFGLAVSGYFLLFCLIEFIAIQKQIYCLAWFGAKGFMLYFVLYLAAQITFMSKASSTYFLENLGDLATHLFFGIVLLLPSIEAQNLLNERRISK